MATYSGDIVWGIHIVLKYMKGKYRISMIGTVSKIE